MKVMYHVVFKHLFPHTFVIPLLHHRGLTEHTHGEEHSPPDMFKQGKLKCI